MTPVEPVLIRGRHYTMLAQRVSMTATVPSQGLFGSGRSRPRWRGCLVFGVPRRAQLRGGVSPPRLVRNDGYVNGRLRRPRAPGVGAGLGPISALIGSERWQPACQWEVRGGA